MDPDLLDALNDELFARASWLAGRRVWPSELHIGFPTRDRITIGVPDAFLPDLVMRAAELTDLTGSPLAWFSRMPRVDAWDDHVHACVRRAFMSCGIPMPHFVVMDHDAWHDLVTGESRSWYRVRPERHRAPEIAALDPTRAQDPLAWLWT